MEDFKEKIKQEIIIEKEETVFFTQLSLEEIWHADSLFKVKGNIDNGSEIEDITYCGPSPIATVNAHCDLCNPFSDSESYFEDNSDSEEQTFVK